MHPGRWQQIERLYHSAREREPSARQAFLEEACGDDPSLRKEVESLLACRPEAQGFIESPALELAARALAEEPAESLIGRQVGSYTFLALVGAGGMGAVYRARDSKLGRDVALKVLPAAFARDPDRVSRFRREAQLLAALNHPNIAAIYGLEESDGIRFLVLELVPGETLAGRLTAGPLGVHEALRICAQVAEALEAAHDKGILHRDLKPANIQIMPQDKVKVLDFGLAKAFAVAGSDPSRSPTATDAGTGQGAILGTAAYMSPEQARGQPLDRRTDIWSFGCVLYEALTGRRAFAAETVSDTIAGVLEREPNWEVLPGSIPASIRLLLHRCLDKNPARRLHDIADAGIEIEDALAAPVRMEPASAAAGRIRGGWRFVLVWGLTCLVVGAITATIAVWKLKPPPAPVLVSRFTIALPPGERLAGTAEPVVAVSPDGTRLAYVATQGDNASQLYLRAMDSLESRPIPGTEGAANPFFSPDGQWVGFFAGEKLKKVSVGGGAALTLANVAFPRGASWGSQGIIAFAPYAVSTLHQVSEAGGTPQALTRLAKGETTHRFPEFLPGGKAVLFAASTAFTNWTNAQVAVQSLETGERRNLIPGGTSPRYARSGHLVYAQGGTLMAAPFDPERLVLTGAAVPVVESVRQSISAGSAQYSLSATGSLVYVPGGTQASQRRLVWVSRGGAEQVVAAPVHAYRNPRLSPDGRQVAITIEEQQTQVWLYDVARETLRPLTFEGSNTLPAWTPDGKRIVFNSTRAGTPNLFWQLADGSGGIERLTTSDYVNSPSSWTPDGQVLAFTEVTLTTRMDIWTLRLSDRKAQPFVLTPFNEGAPRFSPDGRWLAYVSDESGRYEIYLQPYPGPGGKRQISTEGGNEPAWNGNGRELFYRNGNKMMVVEVTTQPGLSTGKPRVLFEGPYQPTIFMMANYGVTADGQRFLMLKANEQDKAATQIHVVLNWLSELRRLVPVK